MLSHMKCSDVHSITSGVSSSPKKSPMSEEEDFQSYKHYQNNHRGKGRGGKRGFHHRHGNSHSGERYADHPVLTI